MVVAKEGLEAQRWDERAEQAQRHDVPEDPVKRDAPRCAE